MKSQLHNLTNLHASEEPYDVVMGNIHFVNGLFERCFREDEIPVAALHSYYVDYYLAEVNNGGTSQFVYNSKWKPVLVNLVREGLAAIGAERHGRLFSQLEALVDALDPSARDEFLASGYFDTDIPAGDQLSKLDSEFYALCKEEDLIVLNRDFLLSHDLVLIKPDDWDAVLDRMAEELPDLAERQRAALAAEEAARSPQEVAIRELCPQLGSAFQTLTAMYPKQHDGAMILEWHFLLDDGRHFYALFRDGEIAIVADDAAVVARAPFIEEHAESLPNKETVPLFERRADAVRPGPYCDETSTELLTFVEKVPLMAWLESRLGTLTEIDAEQGDYRAATEAGWTIIHLSENPDGCYLGVEDTPACWPSSLALAQDLADTCQSAVLVIDDEGTEVEPR